MQPKHQSSQPVAYRPLIVAQRKKIFVPNKMQFLSILNTLILSNFSPSGCGWMWLFPSVCSKCVVTKEKKKLMHAQRTRSCLATFFLFILCCGCFVDRNRHGALLAPLCAWRNYFPCLDHECMVTVAGLGVLYHESLRSNKTVRRLYCQASVARATWKNAEPLAKSPAHCDSDGLGPAARRSDPVFPLALEVSKSCS